MAFIHGFGMAPAFDEFGVWLHLGGSDWQRGFFDAVIVALSLFKMIAFAPSWHRVRAHHWIAAVVTVIAVAGFYRLLCRSMNRLGNQYAPRFERLEQSGPQ